MQLQLAAVQLGKVQDVIDEGEQVLAAPEASTAAQEKGSERQG
jgi:hypothetical protein